MNLPDWWEFVLLALATFRVYRLIAEDTIFEGPRRWLVRLPQDWEEGKRLPKEYREKWALFIECPWCLGFWLSGVALALYCIVIGWIGSFSFLVVWFALSASVGLINKNLDPVEE